MIGNLEYSAVTFFIGYLIKFSYSKSGLPYDQYSSDILGYIGAFIIVYAEVFKPSPIIKEEFSQKQTFQILDNHKREKNKLTFYGVGLLAVYFIMGH